jgi:low affinity Fe/Cu permease
MANSPLTASPPAASLSGNLFARFAGRVTAWSGTTLAFCLALGLVAVWGLTGPLFHYSETWQLVINTGTTIITFLMVFLIQRAQNKDSLVLHLKLNELIAAHKGASNRLINAQDFSEEEIHLLHRYFTVLAERARQDHDLGRTHSVEEAEENHEIKVKAQHQPH